MNMLVRWTALLLVSGFLWVAPAVAEDKDPAGLVRATAEQVLAEVTAHKAELEVDNSGIYGLVEKMVVPHFDFYLMSRIALGRYWNDATEAQRVALADQFKELLVRTYATALLGYTGATIHYMPLNLEAGATRAMVSTRISSEGPDIPIDYRLHQQGGVWKVYDVVIDGISLVSNYRGTFAAEVRRGGVDGLIKSLADRNRSKTAG